MLICLISGAGEEKSSDVNNVTKDLKNSNDRKNHVGGLSLLTWKKFTHVPTIADWAYGQLSSPAFHFPPSSYVNSEIRDEAKKNN